MMWMTTASGRNPPRPLCRWGLPTHVTELLTTLLLLMDAELTEPRCRIYEYEGGWRIRTRLRTGMRTGSARIAALSARAALVSHDVAPAANSKRQRELHALTPQPCAIG